MESIKNYLTNLFKFKGVAKRGEYFLTFVGYFVIVYLLIKVIGPHVIPTDVDFEDIQFYVFLISIILICPILPITVRRLHDINAGGGWALLLLTGIGDLILLAILFTRPSVTKNNRYVTNPKKK